MARLAEQEIVRPVKDGRKTRWWLTEHGRTLLTAGTERIYRFGGGEGIWDGRWLVVLCSVPEDQRAKRHQLRTQLGFAGFGFLAPGVAVSPHVDRERAATDVLRGLDLLPGALVLRAEAGEVVSAGDLLSRAWDLEALAADYHTFTKTFERRPARSEDERFAALVELVHAWRRFPFVDPEIPPELLPSRWPGHAAKQLFDARHTAWAPGAHQWYSRGRGRRGLIRAGRPPTPPEIVYNSLTIRWKV